MLSSIQTRATHQSFFSPSLTFPCFLRWPASPLTPAGDPWRIDMGRCQKVKGCKANRAAPDVAWPEVCACARACVFVLCSFCTHSSSIANSLPSGLYSVSVRIAQVNLVNMIINSLLIEWDQVRNVPGCRLSVVNSFMEINAFYWCCCGCN